MKIFACKRQGGYSGGLIIVAAKTKEEAFFTAANSNEISYWFHKLDDGSIYCDIYPIDKWEEVKHLSTDLKEQQVILEDGYTD